MADEDEIRKEEVEGYSDDNRDQACPDRTNEVRGISEEPNEKKNERNSVCALKFVIFNELWNLDSRSRVDCDQVSYLEMLRRSSSQRPLGVAYHQKEPAGHGDRTKDAGKRFVPCESDGV